MADKELFAPLLRDLALLFGPPDMLGPWMSFHHTRYYAREMGGPLHRRMAAFARPVPQEDLPSVKRATNALEERYSQDGKRRVNVDPGILLPERFVLASGKNYTHRIYLAQCIYADLTLIYTKGRFETLPWTYPDYAETPILDFLTRARQRTLVHKRLGLFEGSL
jgi:hypothetical protein